MKHEKSAQQGTRWTVLNRPGLSASYAVTRAWCVASVWRDCDILIIVARVVGIARAWTDRDVRVTVARMGGVARISNDGEVVVVIAFAYAIASPSVVIPV
jgi:hypothetical protein